jgi:hypothetical protein
MTPSIVVGEIDRISGSGNGMLRADGEEYNLGPMDASAVGNMAIAVPTSGTWAVCLTPYDDPSTYLSRFYSTTPLDEADVEQLLGETRKQQSGSAIDRLVGEDSLSKSRDLALGDTVELDITVGSPTGSYVVFQNGAAIEVVDTYLPDGTTTTLELTDVAQPIWKARLAQSVLERGPEPGTELSVTVQEKSGSTGYAIRDDVPIVLPNCAVEQGEEIRVGVELIEPNGIQASVAGLQPESRPEVGDVLDLDVDFSGRGGPSIRVLDGIPLEIVQPARPMDGTVPVEITGIEGNTVSSRVDFASHSRAPELGEELTVTVERNADTTGYSSRGGLPIVLPECPASEGDSLRVAVDEYTETGVKATVASLPPESRPEVGDVLDLDVELPAHDLTTVVIHDGVPVEISQPALPMEGVLPIEITELRANSVTGRVDFAGHSGVSEGTHLSIEEPTHREGRLEGRCEGIPMIVTVDGSLPSVPDSLPVTVTEIRSDAAYASIRPRPEIRGIEDGDGITVTTTGCTDEYLVAEYEGYPVWVSWPFDEPERPPTLTVEVTEITDWGLFASPPVLPETGVSTHQGVLPAQVEAAHSDHISASVVEPVKGEQYVLPVTIPISFDVSGEIGIEIVGQEQSHLVGIIRALETGENATQVPVYLEAAQETLLAIREGRFEAAAESARRAVDATETPTRRAEALRFLVYASAETILSGEGSDEEVSDEIAGLSEELAVLELPDRYRALVDTELEIYEELLSAGAKRVPDSVEGLQRIAYNVDTRGRVDGIAGRIRRELLEPGEDIESSEWRARFPHPLLVYRVSELCTQFEHPPEQASNLLAQCPPLGKASWRVAPESSPERTRDETIPVVPKTLKPPSESTAEASDTESDSSGEEAAVEPTPAEPDDRSPAEQAPDDTAASTESIEEGTEGQSADAGDPDTSPPAETVGSESAAEPDDDDPGDEQAAADPVGVEGSDEEPQKSTTTDVESTVSTTAPSPTTSQLRELRDQAEAAASDNPIRDTSLTGGGSRYQRAPAIKQYVQARADGVCEVCGEPAPFETPDGRPYLETHHVDELGEGGEDHPDKVAAVCPTCHKRIHYGADGDELNEALRERLEEGLADVGVE